MDSIRMWVRGRMGYRSGLYSCVSRVLNICYAVWREGATGIRILLMKKQAGAGVWIGLRSLMFPIFIRPGTEDIDSIVNNIFRQEYGQLPRGFSPSTILDAGAYIGDTAAYFLSRFPDSTLIALEPETESFQLAASNLAKYQGRVTLLKCALWESEGTVRLTGQQTGAMVSDHGIEVEATTIPALLRQTGIDRLDLVKMDIEGAEVAVLKSGVGGWLRFVSVLLLETHGQEIEDVVIPLLEGEGFSIRRHRNVWYCFNKRSI